MLILTSALGPTALHPLHGIQCKLQAETPSEYTYSCFWAELSRLNKPCCYGGARNQTELLAGQVQVTAVQGFPSLPQFSGGNLQSEEDGFEHWIELIEERTAPKTEESFSEL